MANNPYVNKVQKADGTTIIDISDTTAVASDVASGKYFYAASGEKVEGSASGGGAAAITIDDAPDAAGGTVRTITAVDISSDTVTAAHLETGYTAHDADGNAITGQLTPSSAPTLQTKTNISPSESSQTITADTGYDGLDSVQINAIPSGYVGSGVTQRSSSDLSASGATVTAPAGYYSSAATKTVSSGSATAPASISGTSATVSTGSNTLTLSKSVSVTPSVTAGYVSSGTAGDSSVSLTASVTTKAAASYTPSTQTQTIAANQYLTGAQTINPIPSQYIVPSGNKDITANGTNIDVAAYSTVSVNVASSGKAAQIASGFGRVANTAYTAVTGQSITVGKTGTYDVYWVGYRSSTSGTNGSCLYVGDSAHSSGVQTTFDATYTNWQIVHLTNVSLTKDQVVTVRARSRGTSYYMYIANFTIIEA